MHRLTPITILLALVCSSTAAVGEEERPLESILADEWTAEFEAGEKRSWAHQRITEIPAEDGARRFLLENRGWMPVGEETIVQHERVVADSTGRVLSWRMTTAGPRGRYEATLEGRAYRVRIRDLPPVEGTLARDARDVAIVLALIRRGVLPPGTKKLHALDLPGEGLKQRTFTMAPGADGKWRYSRGDQVVVRNAAGDLVETHDRDRPRWSKRRTTAKQAPDLRIRDEAWKGGEAADRLAGKTVLVQAPPGAWTLRRQADRFSTMTGLDHPLQVVVAAVEFETLMGETEQERLELAERMRAGLNKQAHLPHFGRPVSGTFQERPSADFLVSGEINMEPVVGHAHLVRNRDGHAVLVMGFRAQGLTKGVPLLAAGMKHVQLDGVAPRKARWRRVKPTAGNLTFEIPGTWLRSGIQDRWTTPQKASQVRVNRGKLPADVDIARAQQLWVEKLRKNARMRDVKLRNTSEVDVDGRTLRKAVVTSVLPMAGRESLAMTAVSVGFKREDDTYLEVVAVAFDMDWDAKEIDRVIGSIRWEPAK